MSQERTFASAIAVRLTNVLAVLATTILMSRLLGVNGYGGFAFLVANTSLLNLLSGLGSDAGITYVTASQQVNPYRVNNLLYRILLLQFLIVVFIEGCSWWLLGHSFLFPQSAPSAWWVVPLLLMALAITDKYNALLNGSHFYRLSSFVILVSNLLLLIVLFSCYLEQPQVSPLLYVKIYVLAMLVQALGLLVAWRVLARRSLKSETPASADRAAFFSYSLLSFFSNVIQFMAYRVDYWILAYYRGSDELGWYSLAVRMAQLFWIVPLLLAGIIFPAVAGRSGLFDLSRLLVLIRWMNMVNLVAALCCWLVAPFLIPLVFGISFTPSVSLFLWLLPGVLLFCITTLVAAFFAAQQQLRFNFYTSLICAVVITTLDLLLIPAWGMRGAAIASCIGYGTCSLFSIAVLCVQYKIKWWALLMPGKDDIRMIRKFVSVTFQR